MKTIPGLLVTIWVVALFVTIISTNSFCSAFVLNRIPSSAAAAVSPSAGIIINPSRRIIIANSIINTNPAAAPVAAAAAPSSSLLLLKARSSNFGNNNDSNDNDPFAKTLAQRTCIRQFLSQRAIQSFMFLLASLRDPHSGKWMEDNFDLKGLENYHGTGGLNITKYEYWDSLLMDMVYKPKDVVVLKLGNNARRQGGWSKKNPYMKERYINFEIDIDPPSLVSRIISVREQIANEWVADLDTMVAANELILQSYYETMVTSRNDEECINPDEDENNGEDDEEDCIRAENLAAAYSGGNLDDDNEGSVSSSSSNNLNKVFDRHAMMMLYNSIVFDEKASSPYRKGNFDLLLLLLTQESVHRVLLEYRGDEERKVSFEWLRSFYASRVDNFFDGNQDYGKADDFLEELLLMPPSMKTVDDTVELVDPMRIAEDIIRTRSQVGEDWKEIVENVPFEHTELRKVLLARQMGGESETAVAPSSSEAESTDLGGGSTGVFD